jgi:hypothetical protein
MKDARHRYALTFFPRAAFAALALIAALPWAAHAIPPTVEIASPAPGATICGTITVSAAASDSLGVAGVRFQYNGIDFGAEDTDVPYRMFASTNNVADGVYTLTASARNLSSEQTTSAPVTVTVDNSALYCASKFIPIFLVYYGGGPALTDASNLARFDLIDINRYRHAQINGNTWAAVKSINPNTKFYLYEMGPEDQNFDDGTDVKFILGIDRYNASRGHSMGSLNGNHPELYLVDGQGSRIYNVAYSNPSQNRFWNLADFGSTDYQSYWVEAVQADIINQLWVADGVHADNCLALISIFSPYSGIPVKYGDDSLWAPAMNAFASAITAGLHGLGQKLWCNRGYTRFGAGQNAWALLDAGPTPPDVVGEEGAFAVRWGGPEMATQFLPQAEWEKQVQTLAATTNSKVAVFAHTKLNPSASGLDNWGKPVTFWQSFWYAMGSFLLGKQDVPNNAYFYFDYDSLTGSYSQIRHYDEYDMLDLGKALGGYTVSVINGTDIYWREFERGYVYVNPTINNVSVSLPPSCTSCRQRTHENLYTPSSQLPVATSIQLNGHHAAVVLKN